MTKRIAMAVMVAVVMLSASTGVARAQDCGLLGWVFGCSVMTAGTQQAQIDAETERLRIQAEQQTQLQQTQLTLEQQRALANMQMQTQLSLSNNEVVEAALNNNTALANTAMTNNMLAVVVPLVAAVVVAIVLMMGGGWFGVWYFFLRHRTAVAGDGVRVLPAPNADVVPSRTLTDVQVIFGKLLDAKGYSWTPVDDGILVRGEDGPRLLTDSAMREKLRA